MEEVIHLQLDFLPRVQTLALIPVVEGGGVQNPTSCLKITLNRSSVEEPVTLSIADTTAVV